MKHRSLGILYCLLIFWIACLITEAGNSRGMPITLSPDGKAFTTSAGDKNTSWYENGYEVTTGVSTTLHKPREGEHEYQRERILDVPIKSWKVVWKKGQCVHLLNIAGNQYHGVHFNKDICKKPYYSGWFGYCADCGEVVTNCYIYMSEAVARNLKSIDLDKSYYYQCPHCEHLEQGVDLQTHYCKGVSANRYYVRYHANFGSGSMEKSSHMVNNATEYEGRAVTPQTKLNLNTYTRDGYEFAGWNTQKDGSGKSYEDGAAIYNLSMEENASIVLYAQWRKRASILEIDPNGGSYEGKTGIQRISGDYQSKYNVNQELLTAPKGYVVHFDTMGGEGIPDMSEKYLFKGWDTGHPFYGKLENGIYTFLGEDGNIDRIIACYEQEGIILPEAHKEGYSFGGWYADKEGLIPVGQSGDMFSPSGEITLYAGWVDLKLVSKDNYTANQGKGAVDLSWSQEDVQNKVYEIYQRREEELWKKIHDEEVKTENFQLRKIIFYSGSEGEYTVPYTGFYTLQLTGAQGGNYKNYSGGPGGSVEATVFLEKGEKLEYIIGGQNGYNEGGNAGKYGNGGGYSIVSLQNKGTLLIAGGGGGATGAENGGPGGSSGQVTDSTQGKAGEAGGGGGYRGGEKGSAVFHEHTKECEHLHIGNPKVYGGCYTRSVNCGSTDIEYQVTYSAFTYGNVGKDGSTIICPECDSYECKGHLTEVGEYVCRQCGNREKYPISVCTAKKGYAPACGEEAYICELSEGQLISSFPSEGGSNYVNKALCVDYKEERGVQKGNGTFTISSKQIGVQEKHECLGVVATDMEAPEPVDIRTIIKTAVSDHEIRISWSRPKDHGTDYYHQVKAYAKENMQQTAESNITKNTLVSQVVGYRYLLDASSETQVNEESLYLAEESENAFLVISLEKGPKYLHLAAQDKAGNIGPTIHIRISSQEVIYWPLLTEKLVLSEGTNVASAPSSDTYYVKADGSTPIQLTLEGLLCGTARRDYQIDVAEFVMQSMENSGENGVLSILVPKRDKIDAGSFTYPAETLLKKHTAQYGVEDALFTWAQRYNLCKSLTVKQKLILSKELDGKILRIMPRVAAQGEKETIYSKEEQDLQKSIYLIGDACSPNIKGTELLEQLATMEPAQTDKLLIKLEANDDGSGLAQFYVEIFNHDSSLRKRYEDENLTGVIQLQINPQDQIYHGNFSILVYARDRVGNEASVHNGMLNVGVEAYISRVLEPHTPVFKRGESGVLHISSRGYVERVEVYFPEEFNAEDASLTCKFVYELPAYVKNEEIPFVVPFSMQDGSVTIQVKAYKDGIEYRAEPQLITLKIQGDVRDELRTRLR